jgi:hypothetical protein
VEFALIARVAGEDLVEAQESPLDVAQRGDLGLSNVDPFII